MSDLTWKRVPGRSHFDGPLRCSVPWDLGRIRLTKYDQDPFGHEITAEDLEHGVFVSGPTVQQALLNFAEEAEPVYDRVMIQGGRPYEDTATIYRWVP